MKRLIGLFMILAIVSFTSFGSTADLTEKSQLAFVIDHDVGVDVAIAITVETEMNVSQKYVGLHSEQTSEAIYFNFRWLEHIDNYTFYKEISKDIYQPPNTDLNRTYTYKAPRDSLTC